MGYKLYKGEIMQSQITVTDITILERDVKEDKNDPNFKKGQKTCSNELYDDCIYNMLARTMREDTKDNCTVPYIRDDSNICTNPQVFGFCLGQCIIRNIKFYDFIQNELEFPCRANFILGCKHFILDCMESSYKSKKRL